MGSQQYTVKAITQMIGLNEHTLRAWEKRYKAVEPSRLPNGRRIYSTKDLARLRLLVDLVATGQPIGRIAPLPDSDLRKLLAESQKFDRQRELKERTGQGVNTDPGVNAHLKSIEAALTTYDLEKVTEELNRAHYRLGARSFCLDVVSPLMGLVGDLVFEGGMSISQEHAISAIVRSILGDILINLRRFKHPSFPESKLTKPTFALATVEGDLHEIGIMIAAVLCASYEIPGFYFGASLPPEALGQSAVAIGADIVLVSTCPLPMGTLPYPYETYLSELARNLTHDQEIWFGGLPIINLNLCPAPLSMRLVKTLDTLDNLLKKRVSG